MCQHHACKPWNQPMTRRQHLAALAGASALGTLLGAQAAAALDEKAAADSEADWPDVRVAYIRPRGPYWLGWPGTAWDIDGFVQKSRGQVEAFARELKVRVSFEPEPLYDPPAVDRFLAKCEAEKPRGILLFPLHMNQWGAVDKLTKAGVPTLIFAGLGMCFTGHIGEVSRRQHVYLASSPDFELKPVRSGLKMIRAAHDIRRTKVAVVAGGESKDSILEPLGLRLRYVPRERFPEVFATIQETPEVLAVAEEYRKAARKIVEPSPADLIHASRNYFTALKIMKDEGCQGITMDCLGLVSDRKIPCPPCMAWSKLLDVGMAGVCEADINAVMSHVVCMKVLDKPGFMQDPVPETVNNTFIGAHCVSPTKLNGFDKPGEPFILRSHSESNIGVSLQVLWKPGQDVTIMQFVGPSKMILGKGKVLRNLDTPPAGGCRTSVELAIDAPADTRDTRGFHQLFIYGDHMREFQAYGQLHGIATEHI